MIKGRSDEALRNTIMKEAEKNEYSILNRYKNLEGNPTPYQSLAQTFPPLHQHDLREADSGGPGLSEGNRLPCTEDPPECPTIPLKFT